MSKRKIGTGIFFMILGIVVYVLGGIQYVYELGPSQARVYPAYFFMLLGAFILVQGWWRARQAD